MVMEPNVKKAIFTALLTIVVLFSGFALLPSGAHAAVTNDHIGDLTVFSQDYSTQGLTSNIFAADPSVHTDVSNYTLSY